MATMHAYNTARGYKRHAFEAIQLDATGRESLIETYSVTKRRNADAAYEAAEAACAAARALKHCPAAFVREINA